MNTSLAQETHAARERAFSMPLEEIDPSDSQLFVDDTVGH